MGSCLSRSLPEGSSGCTDASRVVLCPRPNKEQPKLFRLRSLNGTILGKVELVQQTFTLQYLVKSPRSQWKSSVELDTNTLAV